MRRGRSRLTVLFGLLATAAVFALSASTASAIVVQITPHHAVSYQALAGTQPAPPRNFDGFFSNLDYNGGPVMPSNTNYAIYWSPNPLPVGASAYPSDYQPGLNQYFTDIAHDSGRGTNVDAIATQYNDAAGNFAAYKSSFGGAITDTNPYPVNGCAAALICLTDAQIQTEISNVITARGLPRDMTHEYFLITPPGVESCFTATDNICSLNSAFPYYCAFHGASSTGGGLFIYSNDPYVTAPAGTSNGCDTGHHPNGTSDGALEGGLSHEHNESITDPLPNTAWTDFTHGSTNGYENGDKCGRSIYHEAGAYGTPISTAPNGSPYNQVINGHEYYYQQEWSNHPATPGQESTVNGHCLQTFTFTGTRPTATFTSAPGTGNTMNFDATGSTPTGAGVEYHWQFEDTTSAFAETETTSPTTSYTYPTAGSHRVSLTVYAPDGTSAATSRTIVIGHTGPTPSFNAPATAAVGQPANFVDTTSGSASQSWNFGDGSAAGTGPAPQHTYLAAGTYTVTLADTDTFGQVAYTSKQVIVRNPPRAVFAVTTAHPVKGSPTKFSSTGSSSPNGSITSYGWNFGDGSAAGSGPSPTHTYKKSGKFTVRLVVTDSVGLTSLITHKVVVGTPSKVLGISVQKTNKGHFLLVKVSGAGVVSVGNSSVHLKKAGTASFKFHLTKKQLNSLKAHHKVKLKLQVKFTPVLGSPSTQTVKVTLHS